MLIQHSQWPSSSNWHSMQNRRDWLTSRKEEKISNEMPNSLPIVLLYWSKKRWKLGKRLKKLKNVQMISLDLKKEMKSEFKRKSLIFNLRTSRKDKWAKIIIWYLSNDMKKRKRFRMLFISRRKRRRDFRNNSRNKMSRRNCRIIIEWNKKIKWRIR